MHYAGKYDLIMLKLKTDIVYGNKYQPAFLPNLEEDCIPFGKTMIFSGWGKEPGQRSSRYDEKLKRLAQQCLPSSKVFLHA